MKITLPIRGHYKVDGKPSGRYLVAYDIENLDFHYVSGITFNQLNFSSAPIMAEFIPGSMARSLFVGYATNIADSSVKTSGETSPIGAGFSLTASPIFVRGAEMDELSVGFSTAETSASLVRKTVLNDFDSMTLAEMDGFRLYDLSYITSE